MQSATHQSHVQPADAEVACFLTLCRGTFWLTSGDAAKAMMYFREWRSMLLVVRQAQKQGQDQYTFAVNELFRGSAMSFNPNGQVTQRYTSTILMTQPFRNAVLETLRNFTLGRTGAGLLVLGPRAATVRDEVALMRGCDLPLVVRRSEATSGKVQLVGAAYIHGVMSGEWWDEKRCQALQFV
jgi:hypothetical protein